jgi:hypothetical protein
LKYVPVRLNICHDYSKREAAQSVLPDLDEADRKKEHHCTAVKDRGHLVEHGAEGALSTQEEQV